MPSYVQQALHKFQHPPPKKPQDSPYPAMVKQYGVKVQLTDPIDTSARLPAHEIKRLQQIIGTFLFYSRAVDPTLLTALSKLSSAQATATDATKCACQQFLDYCTSHPDGSICYHASDMIFKLHSNSSYLNAVGARSRQGGHLYLGNKSEPDILNDAVMSQDSKCWKMPSKADTPLTTTYRTELDVSRELNEADAAYYQSLIGILRWIVQLG